MLITHDAYRRTVEPPRAVHACNRGALALELASSVASSFPDPDPTSREEKGLVYLGRILGSRSTARADPAMQSSDLIGLYGRTGD